MRMLAGVMDMARVVIGVNRTARLGEIWLCTLSYILNFMDIMAGTFRTIRIDGLHRLCLWEFH